MPSSGQVAGRKRHPQRLQAATCERGDGVRVLATAFLTSLRGDEASSGGLLG